MSLFLMADSDYQDFKALEERSLHIEASEIQAATAKAKPLEMDRQGDTATIKIEGMLTPKRIGFMDFFGRPQTVWGDIVANVDQAEALGIKTLNVIADSGGGMVDGMFEAMDSFANSSLEINGIIDGQAQSAMYMLLSQADTITASKDYNWVGSIGVKASLPETREVSNTDSPKKISGSQDDKGRYAAQDALDDLYKMILPRMAKGRNTTEEKINAEWGQGGSMTAKTALARGMIDMIAEYKPAGRSGVTKGKKMDREQLKAENPDLYTAIFNDGKEAGKAEFKEVAEAHLELAEASGAMDRAIEDIKAGNPVGPKVFAFHNAEGIKRSQIKARDEEAPEEVSAKEEETLKDDSEELKKAYAELGLEVQL